MSPFLTRLRALALAAALLGLFACLAQLGYLIITI